MESESSDVITEERFQKLLSTIINRDRSFLEEIGRL